ncbi:glycosyltransferase family 2 protein [Actinobacteria bacterium YIM 96077]|uniref:Glycosyltransferase family 2 protein n=1 Tax=Phytoactinopolyspora halophila TaxID=1981511 RepID=A0A329R6C2_9ACTN|nr:glycosyltransferase family 2 protein [Phytoactinopolyspora halophila]AYY15220.1 glycosyltransferase family 2 protein [Actinobacteria bacterium YIM 96077]RAW18982.1 glycosyltransferase family 2 protein [Phytoactinopolyspora halophila]
MDDSLRHELPSDTHALAQDPDLDASVTGGSEPTSEWPGVSVIMPVRNEERHLAEAVAGVLAQEYPGELELVVAVGPSDDRTAEIARRLAAEDTRVRLVENPGGTTPAGLNMAISAARHGIVVRVDGHGILSDGYVRRSVEVLEETGAANVGGIMHAEGTTGFERAVAFAYCSKLGLGGGRFHVGGPPGPADTVYLGAFRRDVLDRLGGYDEHFIRAQDWELNYRIRAAGEQVWFTPDLKVSYRPRSSLRALARQFLRTGQWRREVVRKYPDTATARYLAPPVLAVAVASGTAAGVAALLGAWSWLALGWILPAGYVAGVVAAGLVVGRRLPGRARAWLPAVLATIHLSWGAGFLMGPRMHTRSGRP